jgi:hypothetical protein
MAHEYLPARPLIELVEARGGLPPFAARGDLAQAYYRARRTTASGGPGRLTVWAADVLAVKLCHMHPCVIWQEWFDDTTADEMAAS